jgi:hypothetical protein
MAVRHSTRRSFLKTGGKLAPNVRLAFALARGRGEHCRSSSSTRTYTYPNAGRSIAIVQHPNAVLGFNMWNEQAVHTCLIRQHAIGREIHLAGRIAGVVLSRTDYDKGNAKQADFLTACAHAQGVDEIGTESPHTKLGASPLPTSRFTSGYVSSVDTPPRNSGTM